MLMSDTLMIAKGQVVILIHGFIVLIALHNLYIDYERQWYEMSYPYYF